MKTSFLWVAAILGSFGACRTASAQYWAPALRQPVGVAPDMCGPGFYLVRRTGQITGPHYYVVPPFSPETGMIMPFTIPNKIQMQNTGTVMPMQGATPYGGYAPPGYPSPNVFPTHTYMRSPRDYFMFREVMDDKRGRETRPVQVP